MSNIKKNHMLDMSKLEDLVYPGDIPPYAEYPNINFEPKDAEQSIQRLLYLIESQKRDDQKLQQKEYGLNWSATDEKHHGLDVRDVINKLDFLLKKSGSPNIKIHEPGTESDEGFGSDRPYYQSRSNTIGVFMDDLLSDTIAEIPHAVSRESVRGKPFRNIFQKSDDITDYMQAGFYGGGQGSDTNYTKLYDMLGTEEYVAHKVLEPMIDEYINYPGRKPLFTEESAEEFYQTLLNAIKGHRYTKKPVEVY